MKTEGDEEGKTILILSDSFFPFLSKASHFHEIFFFPLLGGISWGFGSYITAEVTRPDMPTYVLRMHGTYVNVPRQSEPDFSKHF